MYQLKLDSTLPISDPKRASVIVMYSPYDEWDEKEWLQAAIINPVFDFLNDSEDDIYILTDDHHKLTPPS